MHKIIECVGNVSKTSREAYTLIQDDAVEGLLGGVSKMVGGYVPFALATRLGLAGSKTPTTPPPEDVDDALARLYYPPLTILITDRILKSQFY
jgi:hypothetical protein